MKNVKKIGDRNTLLKHNVWILAVVWTMILAASLILIIIQINHHTLEGARIQARTIHAKDVLYRRWNTEMGGVYVPVSDVIKPNPYLTEESERDITTTSGKQLTLMNPAYMTRLVHEMTEEEFGVRGHITSLKPIRPENAPDSWEIEALNTFEHGESEFNSVVKVENEEYLRLMRPLITEKGCLKCHAIQGYKEGDIRGGISVMIPLEPLWTVSRIQTRKLAGSFFLLWVTGLSILIILMHRLNKSEQLRKKVEEEYENIFNISPDMLAVCTADGKFLKVNTSWENITGFEKEELLQHGWSYFVHPDDVERTNAEVKKQLKGSSVSNFINRFRCKDDSYKILEWQATHAMEGIVHASARDITERKQAEETIERSHYQLRRLANKIESVREEERISIAGEIHDELGQGLTALHMDLSTLRAKVPESDKEQHDKITSILELATTITRTVQKISMDLRPGILDDLDLIPALQWQTDEFQKRTGVKCQLTIESTDIDLNNHQSTTLYRICQEVLTNITRHARATQVQVVMEEQDGNLVLEIRDNGKGITEKQIEDSESLGIIGMRERCLSCDGEMQIRGVPGKGTTLTVSIPVN